MTMIDILARKASFVRHLVTSGQAGKIPGVVRHKCWSRTVSFGLRRDLTIPFTAPAAAIPIQVRPATERDYQVLFDANEPGVPLEEQHERRDRWLEVQAGMLKNFVAVTDDDQPCYFQSLLYPNRNDWLRDVWREDFPQLQPHQVLMEGALTPTRFRGRKIMPSAMARIAEAAATDTATEAITFVDSANIPSLKGCVRAGFTPYCHRVVTWRLFRKTVAYPTIPPTTPIPGVTA